MQELPKCTHKVPGHKYTRNLKVSWPCDLCHCYSRTAISDIQPGENKVPTLFSNQIINSIWPLGYDLPILGPMEENIIICVSES